MLITSVEPETEWTAIVRLQVTAIHERSASRVTPRVRVGERAPLYAMTCRAVPTGEQFEVEVADLSTTGIAFVSDREFHTGDLVALMPVVDGHAMRLRARVLTCRASRCRPDADGMRDRRRHRSPTESGSPGSPAPHRSRPA